jgi:hypothetical protein
LRWSAVFCRPVPEDWRSRPPSFKSPALSDFIVVALAFSLLEPALVSLTTLSLFVEIGSDHSSEHDQSNSYPERRHGDQQRAHEQDRHGGENVFSARHCSTGVQDRSACRQCHSLASVEASG